MNTFSKAALIFPMATRSNFRCFQAMLISTALQKRREAVETRMVTEDVVE
jgi:hypothetical protein